MARYLLAWGFQKVGHGDGIRAARHGGADPVRQCVSVGEPEGRCVRRFPAGQRGMRPTDLVALTAVGDLLADLVPDTGVPAPTGADGVASGGVGCWCGAGEIPL